MHHIVVGALLLSTEQELHFRFRFHFLQKQIPSNQQHVQDATQSQTCNSDVWKITNHGAAIQLTSTCKYRRDLQLDLCLVENRQLAISGFTIFV